MSTVYAERDLPAVIDPSAGLELTTGDEIALEANRFLFLAMDFIDPFRLAEDLNQPYHVNGGEELDNPCLRRTPNFLPRCTFTPLELWGVPMPQVLMPDGIRALKLKGVPVEDLNPNGRTFLGAPALFVPMYPGEMIVDALNITGNERKGIIEIEVLRDEPYMGALHQKLTEAFWSNFTVPLELRLIEEHIVAVGAKYADPDIRKTAITMQRSIEQSRSWAESRIGEANTQQLMRVKHEHTYSYSPKIRYLMKQLEVKPANNGVESIQGEVLKALTASGLSVDQFTTMNAEFATQIGASIATAIADALKPKAPEAPATPKAK